MIRWIQRVVISVLALAAALTVAPVQASAAPPSGHKTDVIVLPGATSAEGIASGRGSTFYAGELSTGDIFRGDIRRGTAERFIDAPAGRNALGMVFDRRHHLLFVAGGGTGQAYVYDTGSGASVASYQFGSAGTSLINDVALTPQGAWFTDSVKSVLYFVPLSRSGTPGTFQTLQLSGPAADLTGAFNLNGIQATRNGRTLIAAHSTNGKLYTIDPDTGASAAIAGISVPNVDGIVLSGHRLWAVQNFSNQISRFRLRSDLTAGTFEKLITSEHFQLPTTAALFGNTLAVVQAKFDDPTADSFEVVLVRS
jgi:sugar lactone lactonase YvrE